MARFGMSKLPGLHLLCLLLECCCLVLVMQEPDCASHLTSSIAADQSEL